MLCITNCCCFQLVRGGIPLRAARTHAEVSLTGLVFAWAAPACLQSRLEQVLLTRTANKPQAKEAQIRQELEWQIPLMRGG